MRAVVQRVKRAQVSVEGEIVGRIDAGLLVLLGVAHDDSEADADYLLEKIVNLRIFQDDAGKMNRSLLDCNGQLLVVSQFTLFGDCRRGRRPSYSDAAPPEHAEMLYNYLVKQTKSTGIKIETGIFQAMMDVELVNDGPVTLMLDSRKLF
jgi:D-aminoacyl-tRNA deacylase